MERLQKILSAAGVCSRRKAEELLKAGRVTVNGVPAGLGDKADLEQDVIQLDGVLVAAESPKLYLMLNKPRGVVTTLSDERGRPTVDQLVASCGVRVYPVGRLDMDSEGLAHPSHQTEKEYHVTVTGQLAGSPTRLAGLTTLEDGSPIAPARVAILAQGQGTWVLSVTIHQGLNRQVRRMCRLAGLQVSRLVRVREGALELGDLPQGRWRCLTPEELAGLNGSPRRQ